MPQDGRIKLKMGKKVIDYRVSTLPTLFGEKVVLRILDKGNLTLDLEKFGIEPRAEQELMEADLEPVRHGARHRPDGIGQDDDALFGALEGQQHRRQHHDRRRPRRVQPLRDQPGAGAQRNRHDVRRGAEGVPAAGPEHHHGRRDPRPRDGRHRHQGRAHRPPGAVHAAHQLGAGDGDAFAGHGSRAVQRGERAQPRAGAATRAPHLQATAR